MGSFSLTNSEVKSNIEKVQKYLQDHSIDCFYVSSYDAYLNEYTPLSDCYRYYLSGFSGSTAELVVPAKGKVKLYVDGRYHEQADNEVDLGVVDVVKLPFGQRAMSAIDTTLEELDVKKLALLSERSSYSFYKNKVNNFDITLVTDEVHDLVGFKGGDKLKPIIELDKKYWGESTKEKLERIFKEDKIPYFVTAVDSITWLTNCRGYHLPTLSTFLGMAFVTQDKVYCFTDKGVEVQCSNELIEFKSYDELDSILNNHKNVSSIYIDSYMTNTHMALKLEQIFSKEKLIQKSGGLDEFHSVKTDNEMELIRDSFKKADKSIFNTLKWVKENFDKQKISEKDIYDQTTIEYKKNGAIAQSFGTISGIGPNGSIIHYSDPKSDIFVENGDMILLDSGGCFEPGFSTDTTRTFTVGNQVKDDLYKKMYTLVLKGTLACQHAVFSKNTSSVALDGLARQPLLQHGYDYAHGTGHGVGIDVHESGAGIRSRGEGFLKPGNVVSIEPGVYFPGIAGVRIENIAHVIQHPEFEDLLCFENLVYIGYDHDLIDQSLLTEQEKKWIADYEKVCKERGTSFLS